MRHNGALLSRLVFGAILGLLTTVLVTMPMRAADAAVIGDDYPPKVANSNIDPWRFYSGECTSFVAWRINHQLKFSFDDYWLVHWGNASNWRNAARNAKVKAAGVRYNHTPRVGAIAWWRAGSAGSSSGHVAWVAVVNKTSITIEEYNYIHHHKYDVRTIPRSSSVYPTGFLHFPGMTIANTKLPKVHGKVRVGNTLGASNGRWTVPDKKYRYQWRANGKPIKGATGRRFKVRRANVHKKITVRVTASKKGYHKASAVSKATRAVRPGVFTNTAPPTYTGVAQVGGTLTATPGTWDPSGSYSYQWRSGGKPIPGATNKTFVPGPAQEGTVINVKVTVSGRAYNDKSMKATTTTVAPGKMHLTTRPTIEGRPAQVGRTLTATKAAWDLKTARIRYRWHADGTLIKGAKGRSFTPSKAQLGKHITVVAVATSPGYTRRTATSARTAEVTRGTVGLHGRVRVTGHRRVGDVLTAHAPATKPAAARVSYQWFRGGRRIKGATGRTYRTVRADIARHLHVRVTGSADSWTSASARSKRLPLIRSLPTIRAKASVGGPRHRWVEVKLRIRAPGVKHVFGNAVVREGKHKLGSAAVHGGRATVTLGTLGVGRHHLRIHFHGKAASLSRTVRLVVKAG